MLSNVVDQAAQAYDIYLIIYVCVGITEADARGHKQNPLKTQDFTPFFWNTRYFARNFSISNSECEKPRISKFLVRNT